jgi:hypothetical protein
MNNTYSKLSQKFLDTSRKKRLENGKLKGLQLLDTSLNFFEISTRKQAPSEKILKENRPTKLIFPCEHLQTRCGRRIFAKWLEKLSPLSDQSITNSLWAASLEFLLSKFSSGYSCLLHAGSSRQRFLKNLGLRIDVLTADNRHDKTCPRCPDGLHDFRAV